MPSRTLVLSLLAALVLGAYSWDQRREIRQPDGILAPREPKQLNIAGAMPQEIDGLRITPQARFSLVARVLSRERYYLGREADLAPVDLALGWGPMSANELLDGISIRQDGRYYFWNTTRPVARGQIARYSANMHMIPGSKAIERDLKRVRTGHLVEIGGYLVDVEGTDGWRWRTSKTRLDTGNGSCELVYVNHFRILDS